MDNTNYIPRVTVQNIARMEFKKMLLAIKPYTQEPVPEGILNDPDAYIEIERMIGRTANIYAYLMHLFAHVAYETTEAKIAGDTQKKDRLMRKRDALFELGRAVHYKQEACSRMLTAALGQEKGLYEKVDGKGREEKAEARASGKKMKGWESL